jgi:uncharacterized protein (TIGR00369 family)
MQSPQFNERDVGQTPIGAEKSLGFQHMYVGKDKVIIKLEITDKVVQPFNILHGGVSVVLAESCASIGAYQNVDQSQFATVGLEINANHLSPAPLGSTVIATGVPIHIGRTQQVWGIEIRDETSKKLTCYSRCTMAVVPRSNLQKSVTKMNNLRSLSNPVSTHALVPSRKTVQKEIVNDTPSVSSLSNTSHKSETSILQNNRNQSHLSKQTSNQDALNIEAKLSEIDDDIMQMELDALKIQREMNSEHEEFNSSPLQSTGPAIINEHVNRPTRSNL